MKIKTKVARALLPYSKGVKIFSITLSVITALVLLLWLSDKKVDLFGHSFECEPFLALLSFILLGVNQLYRWLLTEAEYSPAYALALGYVNNFLEPVITQLLQEEGKNVTIYVYRPLRISELFRDNIDRVKAQIARKELILSEIQLDLKHGRARDVLTIQKSKTKKVYFDFPNTLTSLLAYIDYKIASREDHSPEKKREELTNELLSKFFEKVNELTSEKGISRYVTYCDSNLNFTF